MNEPCHIWISHIIHEGVMSHMHESCHIWMRHVAYEWGMSPMKESCPHIWISHFTVRSWWVAGVTYNRVLSHGNESYYIMNESCHTYEWVMSHIWTSHVTHMNESYYICLVAWEWVILSCDITQWHVYVWHDLFTRVTSLNDMFMCDMTYTHVWHHSMTCVSVT